MEVEPEYLGALIDLDCSLLVYFMKKVVVIQLSLTSDVHIITPRACARG